MILAKKHTPQHFMRQIVTIIQLTYFNINYILNIFVSFYISKNKSNLETPIL